MNYQEFMGLPLESRKIIEQRILELDEAIQRQHGISLMKTETQTMAELPQRNVTGSKPSTTSKNAPTTPKETQ